MSFKTSYRAAFQSVTPRRLERYALGILSATLLLNTSVSQAQDTKSDSTFSWSGVVPSGKQVLISNVNGSISVERSSSNRVELSAVKKWRRGDPEDVRIELKRVGEDLVVCALWNKESTCDDDGGTSRSSRRSDSRNKSNDVAVNFKLRIPEGVKTKLSSVNGSIVVNDATAEVRTTTVNGSIRVNNNVGPVRASTVNGSITASMRSIDDAANLKFNTVNGAINIRLPDSFGGNVNLSTVSGGINADLPITVSGKFSSRRLRGVVGNGRSSLEASTVNGGITIQRLN